MFEDYLKTLHADQYTGTDDNMSDDFEIWISDLDTDELIQYADDFHESQLNKVLSIINSLLK